MRKTTNIFVGLSNAFAERRQADRFQVFPNCWPECHPQATNGQQVPEFWEKGDEAAADRSDWTTRRKSCAEPSTHDRAVVGLLAPRTSQGFLSFRCSPMGARRLESLGGVGRDQVVVALARPAPSRSWRTK